MRINRPTVFQFLAAAACAAACQLGVASAQSATVLELLADTVVPGDGDPNGAVVFNGQVFFEADPSGGVDFDGEPYRFDGTTVTLIPNNDPSGGGQDSNLTDLFVHDGTLFAVMESSVGRELFVYNEGLDRFDLADNLNGNSDGFPRPVFAPDGGLLEFGGGPVFVATDTGVGEEIFVLNGTQLDLLVDANPGAESSFPSEFAVFNGQLYFEADPPGGGVFDGEPYRFDGTNVVQIPNDDALGGGADSNLTDQFVFNGNLYAVMESNVGRELFQYNTGDDSYELHTNLNGVNDGFPIPLGNAEGQTVVFQNHLILSGEDTGTGRELFRLRNDNNVLELLVDALPGGEPSSPSNALVFDDQLFFEGYTQPGFEGEEPFRFDGTTLTQITNGNPPGGGDDSNLTSQFEFLGALYAVMDSSVGRELFRFDAATDTYELHTNLNGNDNGFPSPQRAGFGAPITRFNGAMLFRAQDSTAGDELFQLREDVRTVLNTNDSGAGSLRQVVADAPAGSTVVFDASLSGQTIVLASIITIEKSLTIDGSALAAPVAISGNDSTQLFTFSDCGDVTLDSLRFVNGRPGGGVPGSIQVFNSCALSILRSTIENHQLTDSATAVVYSAGNDASVTIAESLITGNSSDRGFVSIIDARGGQLTFRNTTVSGNDFAEGLAAVAYIRNNTVVDLTNVTIANNGREGLSFEGNSIGRLRNVVIAGHTVSDITLFSNTATIAVNEAILCQQCPDIVAAIEGQDPLLAPLADNGGPTFTHALQLGSPAIDAGSDAAANNAGLTTDQRGTGFNRISGSSVDIGAFEAEQQIVTTAALSGPGSLRDVESNISSGGIIRFAEALDDVEISFPEGGLDIGDRLLQIDGSLGSPSLNFVGGTNVQNRVIRRISTTTDYCAVNLQDLNFSQIHQGTPGGLMRLTDSCTARLGRISIARLFHPSGISSSIGTLANLSDNASLVADDIDIVSEDRATAVFASGNSTVELSRVEIDGQAMDADRFSVILRNDAAAQITDFTHELGEFVDMSGDSQLTLTRAYARNAPIEVHGSAIAQIRNYSYFGASIGLELFDTGQATVINSTFQTDSVSIFARAGTTIALANTIVTTLDEGGDTTIPDIIVDAAATISLNVANLCTFTQGITCAIENQLAQLEQPLDNGGFSRTFALRASSPARDVGNNAQASSAGLVTDQRGEGFARVKNGTVDIGAFEADPIARITLSASPASFAEDGGTSTLTATADIPVDGATTVNLSLSGTATLNSDYVISASRITIADGATTGTLVLTGTDDTVFEGAETIIADISAVIGNAVEDGVQRVTTTVVDDDPAPVVALVVDNIEIAEAAGVATLSASLSNATNADVTVTLAVNAGGTAAASDFNLASTSIVIPAGATSGTTTVTAVQDAVLEADETVIVDIANVSGGSATENGAQQITTTITDDDAATLSINDVSQAENAGSAVFTVTLDNAVQDGVSVDFATSNGTATAGDDYTATTGTLNFSGTAGETETITVPITSDADAEPDETYTVTLSNPAKGVTLADATGAGTIENDDQPTLSIADVTLAEGDAGTTAFEFTITLSATSGSDVTVQVDTADDSATAASDYTAIAAQTATIAAGDTSTTVTVNVAGDTFFEADETFTVNLSNASGATIADGSAIGTIENDDATIVRNTNDAGDGSLRSVVNLAPADSTITFDLSLSGQSIVLNAPGIFIRRTVTIDGSALAEPVVLDADNDGLIFFEDAGPASSCGQVVLDSLIFQRGSVSSSIVGSPIRGGAISWRGRCGLLIKNSTFRNNQSSVSGGAIGVRVPNGDIDVRIRIENSVFHNNTADFGSAIHVLRNVPGTGEVTVVNSTVSGNLHEGGSATFPAAISCAGVDCTLIQTTVVSNGGHGVRNSGDGNRDMQIINSVLSDNALDDFNGERFTQTNSLCHNCPANAGDFTIEGQSAQLLPLADNGGPTLTHGLAIASPARDAGDNPSAINAGLTTDQRGTGFARIKNTTVDIGAFEADAPSEVMLTADPLSIAENGGSTTLTATMDATSPEDAVVSLSFAGSAVAADYSTAGNATSITIPAGDLSATLELTATDDAVFEGAMDETIVVAIDSVTGAVEDGDQSVTVSIDDDENAPTVTLSTDPSAISETGGVATLTATLSNASVNPVEVTLAIDAASNAASADYTLSSTTISIAAGDSTGTATVSATDDALDELDETVQVNIDTVTGGAEDGEQSATVTITDNDTASLTIADFTQAEGNASNVFTIPVSLSTPSDRGITVNFATADGTATIPANTTPPALGDYEAATGTLNFAAGTQTANIDVTVLGDQAVEASETFSITLSAPVNAVIGDGAATITIANDDANAAPVVANAQADQTTDEDAAYDYTVPENTFTDANGDALTYSANLAGGALPAWLTFTPATQRFTGTPLNADVGTLNITVVAQDPAGETASDTYALIINNINDAPTVDQGIANQSTDEDIAFNFALPADAFADEDVGDSLTLTSDEALGWLEFDGTTFTGTPDNDDVGITTITVTATDDSDASVDTTFDLTVTNVNDAPVAEDDSYSVNEDATLSIDALAGLKANDEDVDDDLATEVSITVIDEPLNAASFTVNQDGSFSYQSQADFDGPDSFTYQLNDGTADSNVATVSITVNAQPDAPAARSDNYSTGEDSNLAVNAADGVLANDEDADADTLTAILITNVTNGTLTLNADGSFDYAPALNFAGQDSFVYRAQDDSAGTLQSADTTVTITVSNDNDAPVAVTESYSTDEDTTLTVNAADGVLSNDTDADGDALTSSLVSNVSNGSLTLNTNGSLSYIPDADFNGTDSFTYRANDGTVDGNTVSVTLTVNAINDAPVGNADAASMGEDQTLTMTAPGVLANDTDVDGDDLTAILVSGPANAATGGPDNGFVFNADGSLSYTPAANFNGTDTVTYRATDGTLESEITTLTITVAGENDIPVFDSDPITGAAQGAPYSYTPQVSDADGDTVTVTAPTLPSWLSFDGATLSGTPQNSDVGNHPVTLRADDGQGGVTEQVFTIAVSNENDAPTLDNAIADQTADEDSAFSFTVPANTFSDPDGDDLTLSANVLPAWLSFDAATATLSGTPQNGDVTPAGSPISITVTATDPSNAAASDTFNLTVVNVNDAPTVDQGIGDQVADEDAAFSFAVPADAFADADADDTLTLTATGLPAWLSFDGTIFTGTPQNGDVGSRTITVTATDSANASVSADFVLTVTNINDAPVLANAIADQIATEGQAFAFTVPANTFSDPDGDVLTLSVGSLPMWLGFDAASATFSGTPGNNDAGAINITVTATDPSMASASDVFALTVMAVNDAPVAQSDAYAVNEDETLNVTAADGLKANDSDADNDIAAIALNVIEPPGNAQIFSVEDDGSFAYAPAANFNGTDSFSYQLNDGEADSETVTVTLTVNAVADAPIAQPDSYSTAQDQTLSVTAADGVLANDADAEGDSLTATVTQMPTSAASFNLNADGSFDYAPAADFTGTDSFTYTASDAGGLTSDVTTVTLTISNVNDAPIANDDAYVLDEDEAFTTNAAAGVLGNDADADGDALTASLVTGPQNAEAFALETNGSFTYTPQANFNGQDSFSYSVSDGAVTGNTATVGLSITAINDAPAATADSYSAEAGITLSEAAPGVLGNDVDAEGDSFTAILVDAPQQASSFMLNANGSFSYTPSGDAQGTDSFSYTASDGVESSAITNVTLSIAANDPPSFGTEPGDDDLRATAGESYRYEVQIDDPNGDSVELTAPNLPAWLSLETEAAPQGNAKVSVTVSQGEQGVLSGVPTEADVGSHLVTLRIEDNRGGVRQQTFTIDVVAAPGQPADQPPQPVPADLTLRSSSGALGLVWLLGWLLLVLGGGAMRSRRRHRGEIASLATLTRTDRT